jgi:hypothetical protein
MSDEKKRDRALQRLVRERQAKTGESYQAAWQQLADQKEPEFTRSSTGLPPLDTVLGGGLVSASVVLLAGPTNSGKTWLTLQTLKGLGHQCLYVTGEETPELVATIAERIGAISDQIYVRTGRSLAKILAEAKALNPRTIAIDSIHKIICDDIDGRPGSSTQLKACVDRLVHYAKTTDTTLWLVGDDAIATTIEHSVDVVLKLERGAYFEGRERIISCSDKNRFGPANAVGCFELTAKGFIAVDGNKAPAAQLSSASSNVDRIPLPFSTAVKVLPGQSAQITARPQVESFWPDRLLIKNADRWDIHGLKVGMGKSPWSSLIEDGPLRRRASMFSLDTWHPLITQEVPCGEEVVMVVTYTGPNEQGEGFEATLFGWTSCPPAKPSDHREADNSKRISERAESKNVLANKMVVLPMTIASPALFVDRFTITDAEEWIVNDIRARGKSIFMQNGDLPGELFSGSAPVILERLAADDRVEIAATYVGNKKTACLVVELSGTAKPTSAQRPVSCFLPLSTDVPILPIQSAQITGRPRRVFLLERLVIADPDDWIVNDIKIGNRSQFGQSGDVPGQSFSSRAVGCHVILEPVQRGQDFVIVTTRGEHCKEGAGFYCGIQGLVQEL